MVGRKRIRMGVGNMKRGNMNRRNSKIDINKYGKYEWGLTDKEIKQYLKDRARVTRIGNLYKKFCKIAGVNTVPVYRGIALMYRHDVERFTDQLLLGTPTYFD